MKSIVVLLSFLSLNTFAAPVFVSGALHSCYINAASKLMCWGAGGDGQLGLGKPINPPTEKPQVVEAFGQVIDVDMHGGDTALGEADTCAVVKGSGKVLCSGSNMYGILGVDFYDLEKTMSPIEIKGITGAKQVAVGYAHACALLDKDVVKCWGANDYKQLGPVGGTNSLTPVTIKGLPKNITQIEAGWGHTCVLASGKMYCWGADNGGQSGKGIKDGENQETPLEIKLAEKINVMDLHGDTNCVGTDTGAYCWGSPDNVGSLLGQGRGMWNIQTPAERSNNKALLLTPRKVVEFKGKVEQIFVRKSGTCAVHDGGKLTCWGPNVSGDVAATGMNPDAKQPICAPQTTAQLQGLTGVAFAADNYSICALKADYSVECWTPNGNICKSGTLNTKITPHKL